MRFNENTSTRYLNVRILFAFSSLLLISNIFLFTNGFAFGQANTTAPAPAAPIANEAQYFALAAQGVSLLNSRKYMEPGEHNTN